MYEMDQQMPTNFLLNPYNSLVYSSTTCTQAQFQPFRPLHKFLTNQTKHDSDPGLNSSSCFSSSWFSIRAPSMSFSCACPFDLPCFGPSIVPARGLVHDGRDCDGARERWAPLRGRGFRCSVTQDRVCVYSIPETSRVFSGDCCGSQLLFYTVHVDRR